MKSPSLSATSSADRTSSTDNERILNIKSIPPPEHLINFFPIEKTPVEDLILGTRRRIKDILYRRDDRLLVIVGPCSIHDHHAALEYAKYLLEERTRHIADLEIVMRVYFEKPRTTVGWKGLINDPYLNETFRINEGLRIARDVLLSIAQLGVPAGSEFLDVISPQYIGDLIAWGAIGARTTESQVHRELASGLSAPVGFKNGTDGNIQIAIDALLAARQGHHFLSINKSGMAAAVETEGNPDCHLILRGGTKPNYSGTEIAQAVKRLREAGVTDRVMVDCSHANSQKQYKKQIEVSADVADQIRAGSQDIFGLMLESHIEEGNQKFTPGKDNPKDLRYGQSITDPCLSFDDSQLVLDNLALAVQVRRSLSR